MLALMFAFLTVALSLLYSALHTTTPYDQQSSDLEQERFLLKWRGRQKK